MVSGSNCKQVLEVTHLIKEGNKVMLKGVSGCLGYGSGTAVVKRTSAVQPQKTAKFSFDIEIKRFRDAQLEYDKQLEEVINNPGDAGDEAVQIIEAYRSILHDETFFEKAFKRVKADGVSIEFAVGEECKDVVAQFESFDDAYLRERAVDIKNVMNEIISLLMGINSSFSIPGSLQDVIVVAEDLTPTETIKMDKSVLRGFITEKGGPTSHTVILAKALGIPAITGVSGALDAVMDGDFLLVDAFNGTVHINPNACEKEEFQSKSKLFAEKQQRYLVDVSKPAVTIDGHQIDVNINAGDAVSIETFNSESCDGIGLLRTEFLYMDREDFPDEDTQYNVYAELAKRAAGKEVIIRTLDIGGDKQADYMNLPFEENPFLGCRAIRLCFDRPDVFLVQLRAILRASAHGNVKIMFPMIVNVEELRKAKDYVEDAKKALRSEDISFNENIPVGIMIETPAAAIISGRLAEESDFLSIGSNDLIGYITATDRMNEKVNYLYDSANLAVLEAIKITAESANTAEIPWGICGEVASEEALLPVWVALGVSELSVAPSLVGMVKHKIRQINKAEITETVSDILKLKTIHEVRDELEKLAVGLTTPYSSIPKQFR